MKITCYILPATQFHMFVGNRHAEKIYRVFSITTTCRDLEPSAHSLSLSLSKKEKGSNKFMYIEISVMNVERGDEISWFRFPPKQHELWKHPIYLYSEKHVQERDKSKSLWHTPTHTLIIKNILTTTPPPPTHLDLQQNSIIFTQ